MTVHFTSDNGRSKKDRGNQGESCRYMVCLGDGWKKMFGGKGANSTFPNHPPVLNLLPRARLSRGRIDLVDLAPRTPPRPPSVCKLDRRHTGRLSLRDNLLPGESGGWARSRIIRVQPQESFVLIIHSILSAPGRRCPAPESLSVWDNWDHRSFIYQTGASTPSSASVQ